MNLKDILVFLDVGTASAGRLQLATNIARDHGANLSAAFLGNDQAAEFPPGLSVPRLALLARPQLPSVSEISRSAALVNAAEQRFRDCLRSFGGEGDWYPLDRADTAELIALARTTDLIIIGQTSPNAQPAPAWRPEQIVIACGRPVLMVPYIGSFPEIGRRVLVAWDGSREAARAVNDALPMIGAAKVVTVMTVNVREKDSERDDRSMACIVRHLKRHGIAAQMHQIIRGSSAISDVLLSRAVDFSVDLIVAGAAHHSPLRGALIGDVSRELFRHMTVPVLMSH